MRALTVLVILVASIAYAEPLGPSVRLPGFDAEQSRAAYKEGSRIMNDAQRRFGARLGITTLTGRALMCSLSQFMQGVIEAAAFEQRGNLSSAQIANGRRALNYLQDVQAKNCERPKGGGFGTGNEGDRLARAFYEEFAPRAKSRLDEVRDVLSVIFSAEAARIARDALIAATLVAAGFALAPIFAT